MRTARTNFPCVDASPSELARMQLPRRSSFSTCRTYRHGSTLHQRSRYWPFAPPRPLASAEAVTFRWGLVPSWAKDLKIGNATINARSETVATKPAFRSAFKSRRCLIVADGFYEWQKLGKAKQPYFIHQRDNAPFAFAGLWERWGPDRLETCSIVTMPANAFMQPMH